MKWIFFTCQPIQLQPVREEEDVVVVAEEEQQ